jgi:hypothetical protein
MPIRKMPLQFSNFEICHFFYTLINATLVIWPRFCSETMYRIFSWTNLPLIPYVTKPTQQPSSSSPLSLPFPLNTFLPLLSLKQEHDEELLSRPCRRTTMGRKAVRAQSCARNRGKTRRGSAPAGTHRRSSSLGRGRCCTNK